MSLLDEIFGSKPQVAPFQDVNLGQQQIDALLENIAAWPDIQNLGDLYQTYMNAAYGAEGLNLPSLIGAGAENVSTLERQAQSELQGNVPADVAANVARSSAFQGLMSGGATGAPMSGANAARNFGLTSLDLINQGANLAGAAGNAAQRWQNIAGGTIMSPAGFVITPAQQAQMTLTNNLINRQVQQERYNVAAAPDPALQALNQWVEQVGGSVVSSYLGGGMGGMGGRGGSNYATSYNAGSYLGGNVSTPSGAGYGTGANASSDVTNPGYYQAPTGPPATTAGSPTAGLPTTTIDPNTFNYPGSVNTAGMFQYNYPAANPNQYYDPALFGNTGYGFNQYANDPYGTGFQL